MFNMDYTATDYVPGKEVSEVLGVVKGSSVRAKWLGADIIAGLRNMFGGEVKEYTKLLDEARDQAIQRMLEDAEKINADAVVNVRFMTSQVGKQAAEIFVYGSAVKFK